MCENLSQNQKIELVSIVKSLYFLPPSAQSLTYLCAPCTVTYTLLYFMLIHSFTSKTNLM